MTAMVSREALAAAVAERHRRTRERKIGTYYPDTGPCAGSFIQST